LKNILKRILTEFFITILFDTISKTNFREVLKNLTLFLNYTNYNGLWRFFNYIRTNNNNLIPDFEFLTNPLGLRFNEIFRTAPQRLFLFGFIFTLLFIRLFSLFKKLILLPFKLGLFSFFYSILGFDVSGFLSWFNFLTVNIPFWIYLQYLKLFNSWLDWWKKIVNIKSITQVPLIGDNLNNLTENDDQPLWKNKKVWIIAGTLILIGGIIYGLWWLGSSDPGNPGNSADPDPTNTFNYSDHRNEIRKGKVRTIRVPKTPIDTVISITDNQTRAEAFPMLSPESNSSSSSGSNYNPRDNLATQVMGRELDKLNNLNATPSTSSVTNKNVLDRLDELNNSYSRPDSPTGSTDSMETITPIRNRVRRAILNRSSNDNKNHP